jgi:hypothetical protein
MIQTASEVGTKRGDTDSENLGRFVVTPPMGINQHHRDPLA